MNFIFILLYTIEQEEESDIDMLRSILAQLEYQYQVCTWDSKGIPFRTYMYIPEVHPITGNNYHEREDFAHVLNVVFNKYMHCFIIIHAEDG